MLPGNHQWQLELYEGRAAELILYGRALGLGHEEAEDVVQETFVGLLHLSAPPINPWFYCLRAYRNRALNYRRSLWRRVKREVFAERWFEPAPLGDHREQAAMKCLERLPPEQREVIVLKIWHDQTFEVIAEQLTR
jgi:DNA-directed RNA polymerase specialized sigma24 family protein